MTHFNNLLLFFIVISFVLLIIDNKNNKLICSCKYSFSGIALTFDTTLSFSNRDAQNPPIKVNNNHKFINRNSISLLVYWMNN